MRWWLVGLLLLTTACGTVASGPRVASQPRSGATPSAIPSQPGAQVLAVVSGPDHTVSLRGLDGTTIASATAQPTPFRPNAAMAWTSVSSTRVYYLNSGVEIRFLAPNRTTGLAHTLTLQQNQEAGFSVSPDDSRIAISIFTYTPAPSNAVGATPPAYNGMRLYVEDLQGGGHHEDIFASPTLAEFPIGWQGGHLVLAVTTPVCCRPPQLNPYGATSIHVVNPDTADRITALCVNGHVPEGPVETFGVICTELGAQFWTWDGVQLPPPAAVPYPGDRLNAVSPDGTRVAVGQDTILIMGPYGGGYSLGISGLVFGWLDASHVVIQKLGASSLSIVDVSTRTTADLAGASSYLGPFPPAIT
jgi:hypothetical protein